MSWLKTSILWLLDACKSKVEKDSVNNIDERLSKIEHRLDKIEKSPLPIGLCCSGLPVMMIGLSGMIDSIMNLESYQTSDFAYYSIGTLMVGLGLKIHYGGNKQAYTVILLSVVALLITISIKVLIT